MVVLVVVLVVSRVVLVVLPGVVDGRAWLAVVVGVACLVPCWREHNDDE